MKKNILLVLTSLVLFIAADAPAQEWCCDNAFLNEEISILEGMKFYAKAFGGANFLENTSIQGNKATYQTGYVAGAAVGLSWHFGLRLESEFAYRRNDISKIDFVGQGSSKNGYYQNFSSMSNVLWDIPLAQLGCSLWNIQPFVGAGIGYDYQKMHSTNSRIIFTQKWNRFSWQAMAGLAYPIFCNTIITLEYKFHQGGSHFNNHAIAAGLVYEFSLFR